MIVCVIGFTISSRKSLRTALVRSHELSMVVTVNLNSSASNMVVLVAVAILPCMDAIAFMDGDKRLRSGLG